MKFRKLNKEELDIAYNIIENRYLFLKNKGIDQYPFPFPKKNIFQQNIDNKVVYCLADDNYIYSIITLELLNEIKYWDYHNNESFIWITAFYSNMQFSGNNIGIKTLDEVRKMCSKQKISKMLLDCFTDFNFLEPYYFKYGFKKLNEKIFTYPGRSFNASFLEFNIKK